MATTRSDGGPDQLDVYRVSYVIWTRDDFTAARELREDLFGGRTPEEATVSWSDYEADHILAWVKGGATAEWNGQVLCRLHNARKGGR